MSEYQLSWTSFKNNLCSGFSHLQQNQEFVDMTLAADGHLVRVHRNILSVASPYIKEMLQSTSCRDPVVFLNNVSYHVLSYILEYIYTGEVKVPKHALRIFMKAAKSLHITGIKDLVAPVMPQELAHPSSGSFSQSCDRLSESTDAVENHGYIANKNDNVNTEQNETCKLQNPQRHCDSIDRSDVNIDFMDVDKAQPQTTKGFPQTVSSEQLQEKSLLEKAMENVEIVDANEADNSLQYKANIRLHVEDDEGVRLQNGRESSAPNFNVQIQSFPRDSGNEHPAITISVNKNTKISGGVPDSLPKVPTEGDTLYASEPIYGISKRGSLQLILNRFIYNVHHLSEGNNKRRWRCIDYRKLNCKAYIDTFCDVIVERKNEHSHEFHDAKILRKGSGQKVYSTIAEAEAAIKPQDILGI